MDESEKTLHEAKKGQQQHDSEKDREISKKKRLETTSQAIWYFIFAAAMIGLNILIQNIHELYVIDFVDKNFGNWGLVQRFYLSTDPYDMPELIGSALAVGITYIIKFFLDKYIVFKKQSGKTSFTRTRKEFVLYFVFAIFTTLENIGIQFFLGIITGLGLNVRIVMALVCGYITKFILDKKYSFNIKERNP